MFKKILKVAFEKLGLSEVKFGDMKISKKGEGCYQLKFHENGVDKTIDFDDNSNVRVTDYISISNGYVNELIKLPEEACFRFDMNNKNLETMMNSGIRFCISTYHGSDLAILDFEEFREWRYAKVNPNTIEINIYGARVIIPARGDAEIRVYI